MGGQAGTPSDEGKPRWGPFIDCPAVSSSNFRALRGVSQADSVV